MGAKVMGWEYIVTYYLRKWAVRTDRVMVIMRNGMGINDKCRMRQRSTHTAGDFSLSLVLCSNEKLSCAGKLLWLPASERLNGINRDNFRNFHTYPSWKLLEYLPCSLLQPPRVQRLHYAIGGVSYELC